MKMVVVGGGGGACFEEGLRTSNLLNFNYVAGCFKLNCVDYKGYSPVSFSIMHEQFRGLDCKWNSSSYLTFIKVK